jgi:hypothetical protein
MKEIKKEWKNGALLLFDDVFEHSAYNYSNKDRAILFIDVIKKLPFPLNIFNMIIFNLLTYNGFIKNPIKIFKKFGNSNSSKIKLKF